MKIFKCPNCHDVRNKEDNILYVRCPCGYAMEQVNEKHNPIKNEN